MKTKIEVDRMLLGRMVQEAEAAQSFTNRSSLFIEVAKLYNAARRPSLREITASVVGLRVKDWAIEMKTPLGKRGRTAGFVGPRAPRKSKREKFQHIQSFFTELKAKTPEKFHNLVDRASQGSRTAAQKLHCLECSGWSSSEVKKCPVTCALWPFRPNLELEETEAETEKEAA